MLHQMQEITICNNLLHSILRNGKGSWRFLGYIMWVYYFCRVCYVHVVWQVVIPKTQFLEKNTH